MEDEVLGTDSNEETFELLNAEEETEVLELPDEKKERGEKNSGQKEDSDEETEEEGSEEGEEDELKEIEEELKRAEKDEDEDEDINELVTPVRRKDILAKYPKLFKDFPYLEKAYYREQQFTEVFPTIKDARVSAEKAQILDNTERQIMSGDISSVLRAAREESQEAFNKIADNYLPALRKADQQAYYHVLGGVIKDTIITMVKEGKSLGEQGAPLTAAANILNQFVFGSQNFQPHQPLSRSNPQEDQRQNAYQEEERQRIYTQFEGVKTDLQGRADNVLKSTIDGHIDPKGTMTDYVKNHAAKEAFTNLETLLQKDARFRSILDKLWEKAFQSKFDKTSTEKIKAAYLSKAKTLLPSVIKKARNDAMKGQSRREREEDTEMAPKKGPIKSGRPQTPSSGKYKSAKDIPRNMSTLDVLMKD